jgi:uncharacterized protein
MTINKRKMLIHAIRLKPGQDLKKSLTDFVREKQITASWIVSGIGSLTQTNIRYANQQEGVIQKGYFEILSLSGTMSIHGSHLHICVADERGICMGGHLLDGNIINTTAEIIIGESSDLLFTREKDGTTEWEELQIRRK